MAPRLRVLLLILACISLAIAASSQNLTTYVPECAQPCVLTSIAQNSNCTGPSDVRCLCSNIRSIGPGAVSCAQGACAGNSTEQIRSELHSGFLQFCSDNGAPAGGDFSGFPPFWSTPGGGSRPSSSPPPTASATTTPSATSTLPVAATDQQQQQQQQSPDSGGGGLSGGAIAGLSVGGVIACIALTGGLVLYAFRLGRRHSKLRSGGELGDHPNPPQEGGAGGGGDKDDKGDHPSDGIGIGVALGTEHKVQLEGAPVSELPTEYTLSGFDPVKELATHEKPVELSADPVARRPEEGSRVLPTTWRL
ncbi:uncharacterized protein F4812DRAFT_54900 [Daldinia caldariorum]|uniref:uncharacterized protein n=1 Tax=Daldinia caldariorum TaxID=326644 RepID=UPI0020074875|nr:uncharacterized protein F4812DRAFT_54900 [Daldinia caldariorum]KAI1467231.1 hypothetical protein F4812DRAFT_54900 [Daldinia caldariorum]